MTANEQRSWAMAPDLLGEHGAVSTEYSVIAGLIGIGMLVGAGLLSTGLGDFYTSLQQSVVSFFP